MVMPMRVMPVTTGVTMAMRPVPLTILVMAAATPLVATFITVLIPRLRGNGCHYGEATDKAEQSSEDFHIDVSFRLRRKPAALNLRRLVSRIIRGSS